MWTKSIIVVVQSLNRVWLFVTLWTAARQASLSFHYVPEFTKTHVHWVGDAIQLSHSLLPSSPAAPSRFQHQGLSQVLALCIRWPEYWSFSFCSSPSNEYFGLISFRIDWFDLLSVQGTLKNLLEHQFESINSSLLSLLYGPPLTSIHYWSIHQ